MRRTTLYTLELHVPEQPKQDDDGETVQLNNTYINIRANLAKLGYVYVADYVIGITTKPNIMHMEILCKKMLQDKEVKELLLEYII